MIHGDEPSAAMFIWCSLSLWGELIGPEVDTWPRLGQSEPLSWEFGIGSQKQPVTVCKINLGAIGLSSFAIYRERTQESWFVKRGDLSRFIEPTIRGGGRALTWFPAAFQSWFLFPIRPGWTPCQSSVRNPCILCHIPHPPHLPLLTFLNQLELASVTCN